MKILKTVLRTLVGLAAAVMFVWMLLPMPMHIIHIGNITGALLCLWIIFFCIAPLHRAVKNLFFRCKGTKILYCVVNGLVIAFLIYGALCTAAITLISRIPPQENATAVVLGAKVNGTSPSRMLRARIQAAERYLRENPETKAVLSGGKGSDEQISEAACMYNELTAAGIAPERLFIEDQSTTTVENLRFSQQIIAENGLNESIAIITDGFHEFRAGLIAHKQGFAETGAYSAQTEWIFVPTYVVREWFAIPTVFIAR